MGLVLSDTAGLILRGREWKEEKHKIWRDVEREMEEIREVMVIKESEGQKRQQKYEHYLCVVTMHTLYCSRQYSTYWPPDCRTTQLSTKSPHFHTTDKVQFPEPWTLLEIPDDGQVQRPNIHENKKFHCLCEKVVALPSNGDRCFI